MVSHYYLRILALWVLQKMRQLFWYISVLLLLPFLYIIVYKSSSLLVLVIFCAVFIDSAEERGSVSSGKFLALLTFKVKGKIPR